MSDAFVLIAFALAGLLLAAPVVWAWRLVGLYLARPARAPAPVLPRAAVLLPLRGADPSLAACLAGLLDQDYPAYDLHIVIDAPDDPAWDVVHAALRGPIPANVTVHASALENRLPTCSLKLSAHLQALGRLDPACGVVALIDADVPPGRDWLRALAEPLADPHVGAVSGLRWYAPPDRGWGSLVRWLWNAAASTQMLAFHVPWGGSLAFRTDVLHASGLPAVWAHCFCEDTVAFGVLRKGGFAVRYAPAATMINRESIDLRGAWAFLRRQLLCARLHHVRWPIILAANLGTILAIAAAAALGAAGPFIGAWWWTALAGAVLGFYALGLLAALPALETLIRRRARERGEAPPPPPFSWKALAAGPLTLAVNLAGLLSAQWRRQETWRGVVYRLEGHGRVRLVDYRPYQPPKRQESPDRSIL